MRYFFFATSVAMATLCASCATPQTSTTAAQTPSASATNAPSPAPQGVKYSYVLVHGAWGGSWDWKEIDRRLRADGHDVYRPSLTGLGERVHLATPDTDLTTHINDVVNAILFEDLHDVILMGHSYGGMVVTGVAEKIPDRIKAMVYVDAFVPEDGESLNSGRGGNRGGTPATGSATTPSTAPATTRGGTGRGAVNGMIPPSGRVSPNPPHDVPQPAKTLSEPISLKNPAARKIPTVYLLLIDAGRTPQQDTFYRFYQRAESRGWTLRSFESDHNAQRSHRDQLVKILEEAPTVAKPAQ